MNKDKKISANDINKFTYCPYQWYYEEKYGIKKLRQLRKEELEKLGLEDSQKSNFRKGQEFHENFRKDRRWIFVLLIIFIVLLLYFFWRQV